jgi:hypothetical protein
MKLKSVLFSINYFPLLSKKEQEEDQLKQII